MQGSRLPVERGHFYLSVPWDLCLKSSVSKQVAPQSGSCCNSAVTSVTQEIYAGYSEVRRAQSAEDFFLDQDLRITRGKILAINKAIRDLNLTVHNSGHGYTRFTECDVSTTYEDVQFKSTSLPNKGKMWMPRVIVLQQTEIILQEMGEEY